MVQQGGKDIGFCQYYACEDSDELWEGYTALGGSYSIDYMIGEPDQENKVSCGVFLASGFVYDEKTGIYVMEL